MIANFNKKQKKNPFNRFLLKSGLILIFFLFVLLIVADVKIYRKKKELDYQVENLKNKIEEMQSKNNDLKEGILKVDDEKYIEKVAREELDLQKPGEKVFSFIVSENTEQGNNNNQKNIFQIWLGWLSNIWKK